MTNKDKLAAGQKQSSTLFETMLDETFERLMDKQVEYSIARIGELEKRLDNLERELEEFLKIRK